MEYEITGRDPEEPIEVPLTEREARFFEVMRRTAEPGEWFKKGDHDWSAVEPDEVSAMQVKYPGLMDKLEHYGIVEHNGKTRNGSRNRFTDQSQDVTVVVVPNRSMTRFVRQSRDVPAEVDTAERERRRAERESMHMLFAGRLVTSIEAYIADSDDASVAARDVREFVGKGLGVGKERAAMLIGSLVNEHHFHYRYESNGWMIRPGRSPSSETEREKIDDWTMIDIHFSKYILPYLLHYKRLTSGASPEAIANDMGVDGKTKGALYTTLSKLHASGYVAVRPRNSDQTKTVSPLFYLDDERLIGRLRENPSSVFDDLLAHIEPR